MRSQDQYFGLGKKILGQIHRISVLFYISFEVTPSSLLASQTKAHLVHQRPKSLTLKTLRASSISALHDPLSQLGFLVSSDHSLRLALTHFSVYREVSGGDEWQNVTEMSSSDRLKLSPAENRSECPSNALDVEVFGLYCDMYAIWNSLPASYLIILRL